MAISRSCSVASRRGTEAIRPTVYGCRGSLKMSSGATGLDDLAGVHDVHAVGVARHHAEVVGDDDDRGAELLRQPRHDLEDLRLDRHVERRGRLVGEQELRVAGQRHRDHHALAHAAGELVRVVVEAARPPRECRPSRAVRRRAPRPLACRDSRCSSSASVIWLPIVRTGFSEVIGSWKTIAMRLPRMWRISSSSTFRMSWPSKMISPSTMRPGRAAG